MGSTQNHAQAERRAAPPRQERGLQLRRLFLRLFAAELELWGANACGLADLLYGCMRLSYQLARFPHCILARSDDGGGVLHTLLVPLLEGPRVRTVLGLADRLELHTHT